MLTRMFPRPGSEHATGRDPPEASTPTDYASHDLVYRRIRDEGAVGWTSGEGLEEMLCHVRAGLRRSGRTSAGMLLELGCGDGGFSLLLDGEGFNVCGIDIAPVAVGWAREKFEAATRTPRFSIGTVLRLPYREGSFDVVVDGHCLHCIVGGDRRDFLSEAYRVLRSDGLLVVLSMCGEPSTRMRASFDRATRCVFSHVGGRRIATRYLGKPDDIVREVVAAGFRVLASRVVEKGDDEEDDLIVEATKD